MPDHAYLTIENQEQHSFMQHRIHKILLVCCTYDGYILEEDGHIESQINREYMELNLSNPPSLTRVESTRDALELLSVRNDFDFVLTMYNVGEPNVFDFAREVKKLHSDLPVVLLTSFSKEIYRQIDAAEFSKFAGILSAALSHYHLSGFEIAQLECHHLH